jgi:hypothetical protein
VKSATGGDVQIAEATSGEGTQVVQMLESLKPEDRSYLKSPFGEGRNKVASHGHD